MSSGKPYEKVRGTRDFMKKEAELFQHIENFSRDLVRSYGYEFTAPSVLEKKELFLRPLGDTSDIVTKEMLVVKNEKSDEFEGVLRPEGTSGLVRAFLESNLVHSKSERLYYSGPMFRAERP